MQVMRIIAPASRLTQYVRLYAHLAGAMGNSSLDYPVPARATPLLEFQFGSTNEVHWCNRPLIEASQRVQVVGLQTHRRVRLRFTGNIDTPISLPALGSLPFHTSTSSPSSLKAVTRVTAPGLYVS